MRGAILSLLSIKSSIIARKAELFPFKRANTVRLGLTRATHNKFQKVKAARFSISI